MKNPLLDSEFLRLLDANHNRTVYAKIISLNQYEYPIEQIEGVVTAGSISIDGESAVRRICQLTLSAKNLNINNVYWGLTTKIKIEIGLENVVNDIYDDIIWFKQGIFILTDFKTSQTTNNYTINLTGKDKMCLLNGDVAGNLLQPVRLDTYEQESEDSIVIDESGSYNLFSQRIKNSNIDDIATDGFNDINFSHQLSKLNCLYYYPVEAEIAETTNISFDISSNLSEIKWYNLKDIIKTTDETGQYLVDFGVNEIDGFNVTGATPGDKFVWTFNLKIPIQTIIENVLHQFGQERLSNIIIKDIEPYALEMVNTIRDDNSERFILYSAAQEYKLVDKDTLLTDYTLLSGAAIDENFTNFVFSTNVTEDNFSLIGNEINYTAIINKTTGTTYRVIRLESGEVAGYRMTPLVYPDILTVNIGDSITSGVLDKLVKCLGQYEYFYNLDGQFVFQAKPAYIEVPWNNTIRLINDNYVDPGELSKRIGYIFDSADMTTQYTNTPNMNNIKNDYSVWGERTSNGSKIPIHARYAIDNTPIEYTDFNGFTWCATEKQQHLDPGVYNEGRTITGGRKYALEHIVDWRHLIYIMGLDWLKHNHDDDFEVMLRVNNNWPDLEINLFPNGQTGYEQYYDDLIGFWPELYDVNRIMKEYNKITSDEKDEQYYTEGDYAYWNKMVIEEPTLLNFWFDFFKADEMGIGKFAVSVIGDRPKTINNSIIKVITYRDAPDVIYCTASEYQWYKSLNLIKPGYAYIIDEDFCNTLVRTIRGRSAHQEIENMLYQYSFYNDTVSITSIPIYYLNPNTLISIKDELSNIIGYYIMTKINLSLAYNGTMTIAATKTPERIY